MDILSDKNRAARKLADFHYATDPGVRQVFRIVSTLDQEADRTEPIKLLEVDENTVSSGVLPLRFGPIPSAGVKFPFVLVVVTPQEYKELIKGDLQLPDGWRVGECLPKLSAGAIDVF